MFCSAGVSDIPRTGLWADEFLRLGLSDRHVPDRPRAGKDWRVVPASHLQGLLQHLPSGMQLLKCIPEENTANSATDAKKLSVFLICGTFLLFLFASLCIWLYKSICKVCLFHIVTYLKQLQGPFISCRFVPPIRIGFESFQIPQIM